MAHFTDLKGLVVEPDLAVLFLCFILEDVLDVLFQRRDTGSCDLLVSTRSVDELCAHVHLRYVLLWIV